MSLVSCHHKTPAHKKKGDEVEWNTQSTTIFPRASEAKRDYFSASRDNEVNQQPFLTSFIAKSVQQGQNFYVCEQIFKIVFSLKRSTSLDVYLKRALLQMELCLVCNNPDQEKTVENCQKFAVLSGWAYCIMVFYFKYCLSFSFKFCVKKFNTKNKEFILSSQEFGIFFLYIMHSAC